METALTTKTPMSLTPASVAPKAGGGWSGLSTVSKVLIIGLPILIVGGTIAYFAFRKKKDEKDGNVGVNTKTDGGGKKTSSNKGGNTNTAASVSDNSGSSTGEESNDDTIKATTTEVVKDVKTTTPTSVNVTKTTTTSTTIHDVKSLPNGGKDCGQVRTTFDRDYDYVKCSGAWWTKSKPNPASAKAKGAIVNWKNLASNKIATERLNSRYPNG